VIGATLHKPTLFPVRANLYQRGGVRGEPRRTKRRVTSGCFLSRRAERREQGPIPYYRCPACGLTTYSAASYSSASACPACLEALPGDAKLYIEPGEKHDMSCTLRAQPSAAAEARRALVGLALPKITREDLALLVSELVTNSVRHAGLSPQAPIEVQVNNGSGSVRLRVHDPGHGFAFPAQEVPVAPLVAGGRGLVIVAALSESWGIDSDADGCTVWCQLAVQQQPEAAVDHEMAADSVASLAVEMATAVPAPISAATQ
jgi:anti-sigma regulatory factor (Ser/Thr protein kinase)